MAGDWIKVEKVTPRKPEVLRVASRLGIHPDHAYGLCFRFWCWCDDNLNSCNAIGVTDVMLDALLDRDGIATALIEVGWLQVRNGSLVIPNFDRHLSESAKKRGLSAKRTADSRSRKCNAKNVTDVLPEKRREEKSLEKENTRGEEFQNCWSKWKRHLGQIQKPLSQITEETQLMQLSRIYPNDADAIQAIEYSISVQAKNLILNGDHKPKPRAFEHAGSKQAKSNDDLLRNLK
jgi:hypothetical protein